MSTIDGGRRGTRSAAGAPREQAQMLRYAEDVARMNRLRLAYERMVPAPLDPRQPLLPRAQVREATLLFTDVRGFTALAERLQRRPGLLLSILNEHFDVAVRAVTRCGGTIEKFLGDGLFASFGAWAPQADHPARGLAAAIGVVGANEGLNRRRASIWGFRLEVGVGVCTGRVVVGPIGTADRYELGIIGDPVNVAARLVAQSGPAEVLLATATYRAVARNVAADLLGNRLVRGRMGRVGLYRLRLGTEAEGAPATLPQSPNAREGASAP